ncbi:MAG: purine-nucleoside phosphorylase [Elusimicrobiota bacterium]|nr:MAG: purine-nucleoside phosphorylase [Elusimicrobiota bacterium]
MKINLYIGAIRKAAAYIKSKAPGFRPDVGFVLGSGLAKAVPALEKAITIPYRDIPGFPRTTVPGHEGKLILGRAHGKSVAVMQGRFHYYEGHAMESIALPVRALEYMGLKTMIVTAAVGSMRAQNKPGHFTVLTDHINLMGRNPLRAFHEEEFGTMFPDMTQAYDARLSKTILSVCRKRKVGVHSGVYVAVGGPSYETPAEIRAFRALGGDVVGMSVVPEVVPARQMGITTAGLVWTSNMAAGLPGSIQNHGDVLALGARVSDDLRGVLGDLIKAI